MKRTAFVTGAEGFIGSHMARFLAAEGWDVIGGHKLPSANSFPKVKNVKFVQCDLADGQRVERLFHEYHPPHVFHLGAQSLPTVSGPTRWVSSNRTSWDRCTCLKRYGTRSDFRLWFLHVRAQSTAMFLLRQFRSARSNHSVPCIRMELAKCVWTSWRENIFWITECQQSTFAFSIRPGRGKPTMRRQISCAK